MMLPSTDAAVTRAPVTYRACRSCEKRVKQDLGLLLDKLEKIGEVVFEDYALWSLSPADTLENIYEEITAVKEVWHLRFMEMYHLIKEIK